MTVPLERKLLPLEGSAVLITGVSRMRGIGYAVARQVAAYGASIAIQHFQPHDAKQPWGEDDLQEVFDGIRSQLVHGAAFHAYHADLRDPSAPDRLVDQVEDETGPLYGLVCNHALSGNDGPLGSLTAAMLDCHYAVNTRSSILLAQAFMLRERPSGRIIFMTSGQRLGPLPGEVAYAASKGAIADVTLTLADQLADRNITVNTVNPGPVDTGYLDEATRVEISPKFPFGRFGNPQDPARLIAWLLTDEAAWITGQVINSEGGFARWRS